MLLKNNQKETHLMVNTLAANEHYMDSYGCFRGVAVAVCPVNQIRDGKPWLCMGITVHDDDQEVTTPTE